MRRTSYQVKKWFRLPSQKGITERERGYKEDKEKKSFVMGPNRNKLSQCHKNQSVLI